MNQSVSIIWVYQERIRTGGGPFLCALGIYICSTPMPEFQWLSDKDVRV